MATMPIRVPSAIVGLALLACASVAASTDSGWKSAGTRDGVTLAFRDDATLAAREVRATSELPFPVDAIFPVVCDLSHYRTLLPDVSEATLIEGHAPTDYEIYLRYAPRYLVVAARDVVLRVQGESAASGRAGCSWSEVTGRQPERKGTVRMPLLRGSWTLEPLDVARSRVVYQVAVKPGGRLPGWLVRRGAVQALPEVIENVRKHLLQGHDTR
jgi:ribosome-associated toxin RatA of RatAB toxin-antitoxin module